MNVYIKGELYKYLSKLITTHTWSTNYIDQYKKYEINSGSRLH